MLLGHGLMSEHIEETSLGPQEIDMSEMHRTILINIQAYYFRHHMI